MACHPVIRAVVAGLREGRFGTPRQVHADLGFVVDRPPEDRLVDPALGGGALLDMGIYPLTLADLALGPVTDVAATAVLNDRGIDLDVALATRHEGGGVGALTASMTSVSPRSASIATDVRATRAAGRLPPPAVRRVAPRPRRPGADRRATGRCWAPAWGTRPRRSAAACGKDCARARWCRQARSLRMLGVMDDARRQIGVRYTADLE